MSVKLSYSMNLFQEIVLCGPTLPDRSVLLLTFCFSVNNIDQFVSIPILVSACVLYLGLFFTGWYDGRYGLT